MAQEIYNEGRVVGLSAWELFKRQALGNGVPEEDIPNEHQWLTAMIGAGSSMILKISANDPVVSEPGVHDFELPRGSNLSAAGVIIANPFVGDCEWDSSPNSQSWAKKVNSYGPLIQNDLGASPTSGNVPYSGAYLDTLKSSISEFIKVTDGIVYTKGATWIERAVNDTASYIGTGSQTIFPFEATEQVISVAAVTINGTTEENYTLDNTQVPNTITFTEAPPENSTITVEYRRVSDGDPAKDINPDFNNSTTVVRLYFDTKITKDFCILFTGFTNKRILQGVSGYAGVGEDGYSIGGSADTDFNNWENGGMLGPEIFPWSSKIVFSVPSLAYNMAITLARTIPLDSSGEPPVYTFDDGDLSIAGIAIKQNSVYDPNLPEIGTIKPSSIIDFNSINLIDYYNQHYSLSDRPILRELAINVALGINDSYNEIVAWYPGMDAAQIETELNRNPQSNANFFPPAIYAAQVTSSGEQSLVPLDVAAPGTVKGFTNATQAYNYKQLMTNNFALYQNTTTNNISFVIGNDPDPNTWLGLAKLEYLTAPKAKITAGENMAKFVALTRADGTDYSTAGTSNEVITVGPTGNLSWDNLLNSLSQDKKIDVLGDRLHKVGTELHNTNKVGIDANNNISEIGSDTFTIRANAVADKVSITSAAGDNGNAKYVQFQTGSTVEVGTNFIKFSNGKKLYISPTDPGTANVPEGSIGIGW